MEKKASVSAAVEVTVLGQSLPEETEKERCFRWKITFREN